MQGKLYQHCAEIKNLVQDIFYTLIELMKQSEGVTKKLKEQDWLEWAQRMDNIQQLAYEIVFGGLIYLMQSKIQEFTFVFVVPKQLSSGEIANNLLF